MFAKLFLLCVVIASVSAGYEEEEHYEPQPYDFGYEIKSEHGSQYRKEKSDGDGRVVGSYGFVDNDGLFREVYYVADKENGFRAEIKTNEPATVTGEAAGVRLHHVGPEYQQHGEGQGYNDNEYRNEESVVVIKNQRQHGGHS